METVSLNTRKPVGKLNRKDFDAFPIWQYADDEEGHEDRDETWVRPVDGTSVPRRAYCHVAVDFITPIEKKFFGFVTVSTLDGPPEVVQGTILHNRKSLFISNPEAFCFDDSRRDLLVGLGLTEDQVFPISFTLRVPVVGHVKYKGGTLP
jgi:hypothetical protein